MQIWIWKQIFDKRKKKLILTKRTKFKKNELIDSKIYEDLEFMKPCHFWFCMVYITGEKPVPFTDKPYKTLVCIMKYFLLIFWYRIFACYTGSKNSVRNRLKIQFVQLNFSKLIFQKSSTDQHGVKNSVPLILVQKWPFL